MSDAVEDSTLLRLAENDLPEFISIDLSMLIDAVGEVLLDIFLEISVTLHHLSVDQVCINHREASLGKHLTNCAFATGDSSRQSEHTHAGAHKKHVQVDHSFEPNWHQKVTGGKPVLQDLTHQKSADKDRNSEPTLNFAQSDAETKPCGCEQGAPDHCSGLGKECSKVFHN